MRESVRLGRIAGVPVGLSLSVFVILIILVAGLAFGRLPAAFPGRPIESYLVAAVVAAMLFFASLLAHELAHSVVARRNGIEVSSITLWLFGGVAQLESEPRTPGADFRIAVVGPLTSLALAVVFGLSAWLLWLAGLTGLPFGVAAYLSGLNAMLAAFNLVPAAPLDGGRVLRAALWRWRRDRTVAAIVAARAGQVFGYLLVALGVFQVAAGPGFEGLWLVLIGLFLVNAAAAEEQESKLMASLHGVRVRDVMAANPVTVDPLVSLDRFIEHTVLSRPFSSYPLSDSDGRLVGLATLNRIRDVPPYRWSATSLGDIACPADEVPTAAPDESLVALLGRMTRCSDGRGVAVNEDQRIVGIVSPTDISRGFVLHGMAALDPYQGHRGADMAQWTPGR